MKTANKKTTTIYMMQSGKILLDTYGESFGYLEKPSFLRVPVNKVDISPDWIYKFERGVIYFTMHDAKRLIKEPVVLATT